MVAPEGRAVEAEVVPGEGVLGLAALRLTGVVMHVLQPDQAARKAQIGVVYSSDKAQWRCRACVGGINLDGALRDAHLDVIQAAVRPARCDHTTELGDVCRAAEIRIVEDIVS